MEMTLVTQQTPNNFKGGIKKVTDSNEFVKILSQQFSIDKGYNNKAKEKIEAFWHDVEKLSMEEPINEDKLLTSHFISDELWNCYTLPQFKDDLEAARFFSKMVKDAMKKEPTALDLFKLERKIAMLEARFNAYLSYRGAKIR